MLAYKSAILLFVSSFFLFGQEKPEEYYYEGEQAKTVIERENAFNNALKLYSTLEKKSQSTFRNGTLYYNIGNTYFQLHEYGLAVYYYYRALKLQPRNDKIIRNLNIALSKLGLPEYKIDTLKGLFFFQQFLSFSEQMITLFFLSLIIIAILSLYLWGFIKKIIAILIIPVALWLLMLMFIGYSLYFSPLEGVLIENSALYRDAGEHFAKAIESPVREGSKVKILDVVLNGSWVKIVTSDGKVGYLPNRAIRLIE